jgi:tetratricopeptide (TPR) repeat protein
MGFTYVLAWHRANSLSTQYLQDANASYQAGNYLEALMGYEKFDPEQNKYVVRGGYIQVEKIWASPYAWPKPANVAHAGTSIDELINQRLALAEAEQFIQMNIGKSNPYFGAVYLRLGELYEQAGDLAAARDVYESMEELFSNQPELIDRAQTHLARLEKK